jgi:hypothetical protein
VPLRTDRGVGLALVVAIAGCGAGEAPGRVLTAGRSPPPEIADACDLASRRCSRCHPLERLLLAHVATPGNWVWYVDRMRHQPESGITEPEGRVIVRCLVFRSFGPEGISSLGEGSP